MTLEEAKTAAVQIFGPGTTLERKNSTCFVKDGTGKTLGMGISWRTALQYAARPVVEERQKQAQVRQNELKREQTSFIEFLVEKHHEEFEKWKEARQDDRQLPLPLASDTPTSETSSSSSPPGSSPTASEG